MGFRESFKNAYILSSERVKLARKIDSENLNGNIDARVVFYTRRLERFRGPVDWDECFGSVFGYLVGTCTTFCPTQKRLNDFDSYINSIENSLDGNDKIFK